MIVDRIKKDLVIALKSKNQVKLTLLRYLKSALKNAEIDAGKALSEAEEIKVLQSQIKQRQQALDLYKKGGRDDLAKHEQEEIDIISEYLPKQLTEEEIIAEVRNAILELNASSMKDMGKVMKHLKEKIGAKADGKLLSTIVRNQLSK